MNFEYAILDFLQDTLVCSFMDGLMQFITFFGNGGWFWIALALVLTAIPKTRKIGFTMCLALLINLIVCNITLKPLIARVRPYDLKEGIALIIDSPHDFSFPSGHTSASFAAACAVFAYNKKWFGILSVVFATFIAFSRLYLYVHFPTDILGGIVVGVISAAVSFFIVKAIYNKFESLSK